jgi:hypothetical protein
LFDVFFDGSLQGIHNGRPFPFAKRCRIEPTQLAQAGKQARNLQLTVAGLRNDQRSADKRY